MEFHIYLRGLGLAVAGAAFWLLYFHLKDHLEPEPRHRLLGAFLWGMISAGLALAIFEGLDRIGTPGMGRGPVADTALLCFAFIGPIEEACKALPFLLFILRYPEFDELVDGVVYASAVAIGFAAFETVLYVAHVPLVAQIARAFTAPLTHSIFAALWGYGLARARFSAHSTRARVAWSVIPFLLSAFAHGLYDFVLLAYDATLLASGVALVLWMTVLFLVRRAVGDGTRRTESETRPFPDRSDGIPYSCEGKPEESRRVAR